MHWIALQWQPEPDTALPPPEVLGWWALQFTPHVAWLDEALLLEVSACERLWGGRLGLMRQISASNPAAAPLLQAQGATSLIALARLRLFARGRQPPRAAPGRPKQASAGPGGSEDTQCRAWGLDSLPAALPLDTLTAAREHLDVLARMGCRTWGDVAALPRGGLARRFGPALREALDVAWGQRPERHRWLLLPDVFEQKLELPALAETAPELMWSANRLLSALQIWRRRTWQFRRQANCWDQTGNEEAGNAPDDALPHIVEPAEQFRGDNHQHCKADIGQEHRRQGQRIPAEDRLRFRNRMFVA